MPTLVRSNQLLFAFFVLTICASPAAQDFTVQHGTVVVIFFSKEHVILAADSRITYSGVTARHEDNQCKVSDLGHETIFAGSGFTRYDFPLDAKMPKFDVYREAARLSRAVKNDTPDRTKAVAESWARHVKAALDIGLVRHPKDIMSLLYGKSKQLAGGLFAGRSANGLTVYFAALHCECEGSHKYSSIHITRINPVEDGMPAATMGTTEAMDLFGEVTDGTSRRGVAESDSWETARNKPDRDAYVTMRTGEFILRNSKNETVAGPLNALELTADGHVHWVKREKNCQ